MKLNPDLIATSFLKGYLGKIIIIPLLLFMMVLLGCQQTGNSEKKDEAPLAGSPDLIARQDPETKNAITVVNWNIEWLGAHANGPKDKQRQLSNAIKVIKYLHADLYCLCEIVDPQMLRQLTHALGDHYGYAVSDYASGARSPRDPYYASAQKLAFIYNKEHFKNLRTDGYLQEDPRLGYYLASGRYPFRLRATLHTPQVDQDVSIMIIHAKSGADFSSYERRQKAAERIKKELDKKQGQAIMLLGDFNDHVNNSITKGQPSPYVNFVRDPGYHVLTLALSAERSTIHYPGVIDQQVITSGLNRFYLAGSIKIRHDINQVVPDYNTGNTSDHYPVSSVFIFDKNRAAQPPLKVQNDKQQPLDKEVTTQGRKNKQDIFSAKVNTGKIQIQSRVRSENIQFTLYNKRHHKVLSVHRKYIEAGDFFVIKTPALYSGDYTLMILSNHGKQVIPFRVG